MIYMFILKCALKLVLKNILTDSSLLGFYVVLSRKELRMFRRTFGLSVLVEEDTVFIPNIGNCLSADTA